MAGKIQDMVLSKKTYFRQHHTCRTVYLLAQHKQIHFPVSAIFFGQNFLYLTGSFFFFFFHHRKPVVAGCKICHAEWVDSFSFAIIFINFCQGALT